MTREQLVLATARRLCEEGPVGHGHGWEDAHHAEAEAAVDALVMSGQVNLDGNPWQEGTLAYQLEELQAAVRQLGSAVVEAVAQLARRWTR